MSIVCGCAGPASKPSTFLSASQRTAGCASSSAAFVTDLRVSETLSASHGGYVALFSGQSVAAARARRSGSRDVLVVWASHGGRRPVRRAQRVSFRLQAAESSFPTNSDGSINASIASPTVVSSDGRLVTRIATGVGLGAFGASVIALGGLAYLVFMITFVYQAAQEYFGFVTMIGVRGGASPPPRWASALVTLCCMALPVYTYVMRGKIALALAISCFVILSVIATTNEQPTLSSFAQAIFGLLYCGYLPTYWVKLRMLDIPAVHTVAAGAWPTLLGGVSHITVGFIATFTAIACIVASDCGAFVVGKAFGRTPLTRISPMKTVEGAVGGLAAAVAVALLLQSAFCWPLSRQAAVGLGVVVFCASVLGDIIESVMKRDAGTKDSGSLIPGHGGLLDRFDSYMFTGAVVHLYMSVLPCFGV